MEEYPLIFIYVEMEVKEGMAYLHQHRTFSVSIHIALFPLFPVKGSIVCSHQFVRDGAASRHALFIMHHAWNDFSSFFLYGLFLTSLLPIIINFFPIKNNIISIKFPHLLY